ncbi:MAG: glycoside hydrolase [Naasia sp.]|jgi:beta-xylosidase|uniref:glycoside hydrolase family 43 protein n=1 Tax=Naasia sp. TaxID=2546198 RepID=UPI00262A0D20|nr:glycoside hydrolase family 43 protein [Naasia sp.]MCU1569374.1 glycoside hydrolase [Naasia sp.]
MTGPVYPGYFADPFVLKLDSGYVAYGTGEGPGERAFEALTSPDLLRWTSIGRVLERLPEEAGDEYWAPEVAHADDRYWMYYSVGHGISGHHLRVAVCDSALGPFVDCGVNLTPGELFAIDPHPFRDVDGSWYLYFARDVLEAERPGTHLAVAPLASMTTLAADATRVLSPNDDWQIYERRRVMYGATYDWHTLEGPSVVRRHDRYWMTFSGGAWTGPGYGVSWAVSDAPLGPWEHAPVGTPPLLASGPGLVGPGHNSLVVAPDGSDAIVFHAWNADRTARQMWVGPIRFGRGGPALE